MQKKRYKTRQKKRKFKYSRNPAGAESIKVYLVYIKCHCIWDEMTGTQAKPSQAKSKPSQTVCNSSVCISHLCHANSRSFSPFVCLWIKRYHIIIFLAGFLFCFTFIYWLHVCVLACVYFVSCSYACFSLKLLSYSLHQFFFWNSAWNYSPYIQAYMYSHIIFRNCCHSRLCKQPN